MSRSKKVLPGVAAVAGLVAILAASLWPHRNQVPVQVSRVRREDLTSTVRASGEVIPTSYVNVLGQGYGRVIGIFVHEGEFVHPGELLLQVDPVQAASTVRADEAAAAGGRASLQAAQAALAAARAQVSQDEAALEKAQFDWQHEEKLYQVGVISRQAAESYRTTYADAQAVLAAARAQVAVASGNETRVAGQLNQAEAVLVRDQDVLNKTTYRAPIAGKVTDVAVRVGENVIPGVPDSSGAYLMTISDLSDPVARVRVDENDIPYLRQGQPATIQIDAFPGESFVGRVRQVGVQAIEAATGMATSQVTGVSSGQQATNYQVDLAIENPPKQLLPGMTVTSVIQTTHKRNIVVVPFQSLVLRPKDEAGRTSLPKFQPAATVQMAATAPSPGQTTPEGEQGVFVVRSGRAIFEPVQIGVIGESDVEALSGVHPGEEIVVGNLNALQELHSGMGVRVVHGAN
jgi:HlyD family secretion protein